MDKLIKIVNKIISDDKIKTITTSFVAEAMIPYR